MTEPTSGEQRSQRQRPVRATGGHRKAAVADGHDRHPRGSLRRQQILDAAVQLFAEKGYRGTGLAALGERVGMTATGLLYYFGSKERLLHEVVVERDRADEHALGSAPTLLSLRDLGAHNVETATLLRLYVVLAAESLDPDEPLHDFFVERNATARSLVRSILDAERASGRVRDGIDLDQRAAEIIATLMGLQMQWLMDPGAVDLTRAMQAYVDRLIDELAP